ncbi:MAG: F0F1 ATP synthase subunit B [Eubacterium sp.]|nr:F0F1 ATP synthase subunit B [Eubacterium sp.]
MDKYIFGLDGQLLANTGITLIAMLFLFILLSYLLFNPARKLIEKRKEYIQGQLDDAAEAKKDALEMKASYDEKIANADAETAEILATARKKALDKEKKIVDEASEEARKIKARAEKEVALEKDKVKDEMKQEMIDIASAMASRFVETSMDEAKQAELVDETLKEMGDETWQS